jgi:hypothetical protein
LIFSFKNLYSVTILVINSVMVFFSERKDSASWRLYKINSDLFLFSRFIAFYF